MRAVRWIVGSFVFGLVAPGCTVFGSLSDYEVQGAETGGTVESETGLTPGDTAPAPACTKNEDCFGVLAGSTPPNCADAFCEAEKCVYRAKDSDGDKHTAAVCAVGSYTVELGDDCNDNDAKTYPGAWDGPAEGEHAASCDGIDNDCSKTADDGKDTTGAVCACEKGKTAACSELEDGTAITYPSGAPQGSCKKGERTCDDMGKWGKCIGAVAPATPDCTKTDDLDCDGAKDDTQLADCSTTDGCTGKKCGAAGTCMATSGTKEWGVDTDNDGYCAGKTSFCAGKTPGAGFREVSACVSLTDDCDTNPAAYRNVSIRTDADNDTHCTGTTSTVCTTGSAPAGMRLASTCTTDDACDSNPSAWTNVTIRTDSDSDTHCSGSATTVCTNGAAPAGARLSASCVTPDDQCDGTPAAWVTASVRADGDGDSHCVGAVTTVCNTTGSAPAGYRLNSACVAPDDACDSNASGYTTVSARYDGDGDGHCTGGWNTFCTTGSPPSGWRTSCVSPDDACDSNGTAWVNQTYYRDQDGDGWCAGTFPSTVTAYSSCTNGSPPSGYRTSCGYDCKDDNGSANVSQRAADGSAPCGYPMSNINPWGYRVDGGAGGVSSTGGCTDAGYNSNCRRFTGSCPAGYHIAGCWTAHTGGGACSHYVVGLTGTSPFSGELRLGIAAWQTCYVDLYCDCTVN